MAVTSQKNGIHLGTSAGPRVLVVENDEMSRLAYQELLAHWGYIPVIAVGDGKFLLENARAKANEYRCQLAIIDMRLLDDFDEDDKSGLNLIQKLKPAVCIMVSGRGDLADARKSAEKGAAGFVGKEEGPEVLKEKLESEAQKICAYKRGLVVEPVEMLGLLKKTLFGAIPEAFHDQLMDGFSRLFPEAHTLRVERIGTAHISSDFSTVPRPKSVILRVYEDDKQPVIIKFARAKKIQQEVDNFKREIEGRLFGNFVPVLKGVSLLWDIGGVKFSYVGTLDQTFANFFREQPTAKIKKSLNNFFKSTWQPHYKHPTPLENISLYQLYCDVWENEWVERIYNFHGEPPDDMMPTELRQFEVIDPIKWMQENIIAERDISRVDKTQKAVTHGDLHGDNILVDANQNIWVVDFERTKSGHILQDFIELESDIINRLPCTDENLPAFFSICLSAARQKQLKRIEPPSIARADPAALKVISTISHLRLLARQCTGVQDARQYLLGLLFNTVFRATLLTSSQRRPAQKRALMLASILCHRLENWEAPWPPPEWEKLSTAEE